MTQSGDDVRGGRRAAFLVLVLASVPVFAAAMPGRPWASRSSETAHATVASAAVTAPIQVPDLKSSLDSADDDAASDEGPPSLDGELADGPPEDEADDEVAAGAPLPKAPPNPHELLERAAALAGGVHPPEWLRQAVAGSGEAPCLSVGSASWGRLVNGVRMPDVPSLRVRADGIHGTPESVAAILYAVQKVRAAFPGTPPLVIGDLSREHGGRFRPHRSHQAGRDADIGYYLKNHAPTLFDPASPANLDLARTWAFIEALVEDDKVEYLFIDRRLQKPLLAYAREVVKVPESRLGRLFAPGAKGRAGIIRHVRGHRDHMHVRFRSPIAVAAAADPANKTIIAQAGASPELMTVRLTHKVKKGETLSHIARRYKVTVRELLAWNRLTKKSILRPGQKVRVLREREVRPSHKGPRTPGT